MNFQKQATTDIIPITQDKDSWSELEALEVNILVTFV